MNKEKTDMTTKSPRTRARHPFIWLHTLWLLLWGAVLGFMLLPSSQAGHPPIIVFWFYPVGYGIFGHLFLLVLGFLKRVGNKVAAASGKLPQSWPWPVWIAVMVFTMLVLSGLVTVALYLISPRQAEISHVISYVLPRQLLPGALAVIGIFGIVTRKPWTRFYVPALAVVVWAVWPGPLIYAAFLGKVSPMTLVNFSWLSALLLGFAIWFFRSGSVKRFFGIEGHTVPVPSQSR